MSSHPIYQDVILKHNRDPQGYGELSQATHHADGFSRLCGEHLDVYLVITDEGIDCAGFTGDVSAVAMAAASIMIRRISGKSTEELVRMTAELTRFLDDPESEQVADWIPDDPELASFAVLSRYRSRKAAALLPWQTACKSIGESGYDV